jgi:hypothetical protein
VARSIDLPKEDFQRGELLFALWTGPTIDGSTFITYLPVRFVTRVNLDQATGAALPAAGDPYDNVGTPVEVGQTVALVDIPEGTSPGTRFVFVERWKRNAAPPHDFEKLPPVIIETGYFGWNPWLSWADWTNGNSHSDRGFELRILTSTQGPRFLDPFRGFDQNRANLNYAWRQFGSDLSYLVPNPKLRIWIGDPSTSENPAAWEATLSFPAGKLEITGATIGRRHLSGALVRVTTETGADPGCQDPGMARISLVDPDRLTGWVDVVYRLRDFEGCGRADINDFEVETGWPKAYGTDGETISAFAYPDPGYSF